MRSSSAASRLHILLLAEYSASGGTRTYFKQLLTLYAEKQARVTVVRTYEEEDEEINLLCSAYGFRCVDLSHVVGDTGISNGRFPLRHLVERRAFRQFVAAVSADVVVASVGTPGLFLGAIRWAKRSIYILHTCQNPHHGFFKQIIMKSFFSLFVRSSTHILTVSKFSEMATRQAWGLWGHGDAISVVYSTMGNPATACFLIRSDKITVLTIGHVVWYKNPVAWINTGIVLRKRLPEFDIRFKWVGCGPMIDECRSMTESLGAENFITFVGMDSDIDKYYDECDIYMQPSLIENLSLSMLDAARRGKPCIAANVGASAEIVEDGKTGWLVDPCDVDQMASRIELLIRDPEIREAMGKRALAVYKAKFLPARWTDEMWRHHIGLA